MQCDKRKKSSKNQLQNNKSSLHKTRNHQFKMNPEKRQSSLISDLQCSLLKSNPKLNDLTSIFLLESETLLKEKKISMMMTYLLEDKSLLIEKFRFK